MKLNLENITAALVHNGYEEKLAAKCAPKIRRFLDAAKLEDTLMTHPSFNDTRQLEFITGDRTCSVNRADVVSFEIDFPPKLKWIGGTWQETAPLTYLARVCEIGERLLGENWPVRFTKRLADRSKLLDVLNEVWWLGCWPSLRNPKMSVKQSDGGDNDWCFNLDSLHVNMQVKRRRNDLLRKDFPGRPPYGLFDKLADRFAPSPDLQINVGAITIYSGITDAVLRCVDDYFRSGTSCNVDAIVLWSATTPQGFPAFFIRARKHGDLLKSAFRLDEHDLLYDTITTHPISLAEAIG